jgi:hypothetical protein
LAGRLKIEHEYEHEYEYDWEVGGRREKLWQVRVASNAECDCLHHCDRAARMIETARFC